jgi:hypothetical protein
VANLLSTCYWHLRSVLFAQGIVREILPTLRRDAQRKYGVGMPSSGEGESYLRSRAAQLAQPLVDEIVRANPQFPSVIGNSLLLRAADDAAAAVAKSVRRGGTAANR